MPDTAITAKFGMDATPFQRGLADVRNRLRSIDKTTQDLNRTMGKFTQLMGIVGAGALAFRLMASFFERARDRADELEGSMNKNAEAVRNFSRSWEDFKEDGTRIFADFGVFVIGGLNRIGEKLGETIARMRNVTFGGMTEGQHAMLIEQSNRAIERQAELDRMQQESAERLKKNQDDLRKRAREMSSEAASQQARANNLVEQEAKLRDAAFLRSLSQQELAEEMRRRINAGEEQSIALLQQIYRSEQDIAALEKESADASATETEKLEKQVRLDEARANLAKLQTDLAASRLSVAEYEVKLAETLAALEERSAEASRRKREEEEAAAKAKQEQLANLRREAAQARTNLAQAQLNEEEAKADRVAPTIEEAAEKGRGRIKRLAQTALDLEERARDAFLRGNRDKGLELEERARAHREQLSGLIQTADSSPLRSVAQNTAQAAETLEKILEQLKTTEADHAA